MADDNNLDINIGINPAGAESGAKRTSAAVGGVVQNAKDLDAAFRRLKSSIDPTFAAQDKYNRSISEYDRLLKAGKISQAEYAKYLDVLKRAYDSQVEAINRNSSAAKQAAADKKALLLQEAKDREAAAMQQKAIADAWVQQEKRNTQALRAELAQRTLAQKAAIAEAAAAARTAAAESVATRRGGGESVTKAEETRLIREAAAAAKQAAREKVQAEKEADAEILAAYRNTQATAKELAAEAATTIVASTRTRGEAEKAVAEALTEVEKAERREATQAAREAAAAAVASAKQRVAAEKEVEAGLKRQKQADEDAAVAAKKHAQAVGEMRASIDPAFAAQQRYNDTMKRATELLMMGSLKAGEWTKIQKQAATQMEINSRQLGRMNQTSVQLGYQMQDVTASIASGINPLVIFAQQSGQVAYAMQGMGGTAGKVAAIMGGVWFQALTAGVIILAALWDANKKAEKSTKDVMDAEDRRKMSVKELTTALRDYTKAQHDANQETLAGNMAQQSGTAAARSQVIQDYIKATAKVADLKTKLAQATAASALGGPDMGIAVATLNTQLWLAERNVENLKQSFVEAQRANAEAAAQTSQTIASQSEMERRESQEKTALYEGFLRDYQRLGITAAEQVKVQIRYQQELTAVTERYKKLKEAESAATRQATRDEAQLYKSRNDAITTAARSLTKQGFQINPNHSDPNKIGNHPGMGNVAHADHAIDINLAPGNQESQNPAIKARMDQMVRQYQAAGFRILWNGKVYEPGPGGAVYDIRPGANQHKDHAHMEAPANLVGKPKGLDAARDIAQEQETIEQQLARARIEIIDTAEETINQNLDMSNGEKLDKIKEFEAERRSLIELTYGVTSKQAEEAKQHELQVIARYNALIVKEEENRERRVAALATTTENAAFSRDQNETGMRSDVVDYQSNNGLITARQEVAARRQILDQEYQDQLTHEAAMSQIKLNQLRASLEIPNQEKEHIAQINEQIEQAEAEHLATLTGLQQQYGRDVAKSQMAAASITMQAWRDVTTTLTQSLSSGLQQIWMRQQTVSGMLLNMADQMVFKFMDMGVQMLQNWVMSQLGMTAASQAGGVARAGVAATAAATEQGIMAATASAAVAKEAVKTAAAVSGATAQTGVAATAGVGEITTNAAVAAAGAFKSTVVIPFIGPVAAPAAAALALAAVLGFASLISAEGGMGEVDRDQLAMVHKKEMILPAWIAEPMRQSLSSPTAGSAFGAASLAGAAARDARTYGDSFEFNYQPKHTNMGSSMDELLRKDGQSLRKWMKNEIRNGNLKVPK